MCRNISIPICIRSIIDTWWLISLVYCAALLTYLKNDPAKEYCLLGKAR